MKSIVRNLSFLAAAGALLAAGPVWSVSPSAAAPAAAPAATAAGTATLVTGHVSAATPSGEIRDLTRGSPVYEGEVVITGGSSMVNIEFSDGGRVLLRPETRFQIERYQYAGAATQPAAGQTQATQAQPARQESAFFRLLKGGFRAVSGLIGHTRREDYAVQTPVATIGIRGTDYEVRICQADCGDVNPAPKDGLYAGVQSGSIALTNQGGTTTPKAGQYVYIAGNGGVPTPGANRPAALTPLPDPKTCN
jgi:hypothetical protein